MFFLATPTGAPILGQSSTVTQGPLLGQSTSPTQGPLLGQSTAHTQGPLLGQSSTSTQAPSLVTGHTTGAPSLCVERWSNWINKDTPSTGDGDREMLTPSELKQFCGSGKIKAIECETTTGIASYSTGEIAMCTIEGGSVCLNADNDPMPCSDYKIRYFCECGMYPLIFLAMLYNFPLFLASIGLTCLLFLQCNYFRS